LSMVSDESRLLQSVTILWRELGERLPMGVFMIEVKATVNFISEEAKRQMVAAYLQCHRLLRSCLPSSHSG
jgi:hypothetical protein